MTDKTYASIARAHASLAVLQALSHEPSGRLPSTVLDELCRRSGFSGGRAWMLALLRDLVDLGAVTLDENCRPEVASITENGANHAEGRIALFGIQPASRGLAAALPRASKSDLTRAQRQMAHAPDLIRAALGTNPADEATATEIVASIDAGTGLGLDQDLRHLSGQVARQNRLPRNPQLDHRFLNHLEWALRDLALRPFQDRKAVP